MPELRFRTALDGILQGSRKPVMHFQPIVDLRRGCTVGYEALARFPAPPQLGPDEWLHSAHARGKRMQLEGLLARMAMEARDRLPPDTFLTVNLSPSFLLSEEFTHLLAEQKDLARMVLEITEGDRIRDYGEFRVQLERAIQMGGSIAIDDTGSGYASLKHVMELRPQFVKLDRFFISGCQQDPAKSALIQMIGEAADNMDAWLIAEGIETDSELFELMRHKVPLGQGYLLGRPSPEMLPLKHDLGVAIRQGAELTVAADLRQHLELVAVTGDIATAEVALKSDENIFCAVVVDGYRRPASIVELHPVVGIRTLPQPMRVQLASSVTEVLRRAISRPMHQRFDPLVAINERGEFEGLLRIDRLTQAALDVRP